MLSGSLPELRSQSLEVKPERAGGDNIQEGRSTDPDLPRL